MYIEYIIYICPSVRDIAFYGCSEIIRIRNFTIFTLYATIFGRLTHV